MSDQSEVAMFVAGFRGLAAVVTPIGPKLLSEFAEAERMRQDIEERWLKDLRQYRGIYEPDVAAKIATRSKTFTKKTRVKVRQMNDRVFDLLFPTGKGERNFSVSSTPEPDIAPEARRAVMRSLQRVISKAENRSRLPSADEIRQAVKNYAMNAAERMTSVIDDQLIQSCYPSIARTAIHSGNLYGTGIIKGPLVDVRHRTRFQHDGRQWGVTLAEEYLPFVSNVPLWRFFPDMAATDIKDCRYVWERHRFTKAQLLRLAKNPSFDAEAINRYSMTAPANKPKTNYEQQIKLIGLGRELGNDGSFEVLERWGWIDGEDLCSCPGMEKYGSGMVFANTWMTPTGEILKFSPQPIQGMLYPYHLYYYDRDETSIFGEGIASIMRDEQDAFNAARRAGMDNLAITAGPQFEVNTDLVDPRFSPSEMRPFALWYRSSKGDAGSPAIRVHNAESHLGELLEVGRQADAEIDEVTGIPKFFSGDGPADGAGATARGFSMALGQANIGVKAQVTSFDLGVTEPFIKGMVCWNMQFNTDPSIKGDYDVQATGTKTLVAKEVRSQMLAQFTGSLSPLEQGWVKWDRLVAEKARAHDLSDVVKSKDEMDREMNSPAGQMQQKMIQMSQQLQLQALAAQVANTQAKALREQIEALNRKVEAAYAAMQAGGVAVMNPAAAAAGDEILRAAGWQDAPTLADNAENAAEQGLMPENSPLSPEESPHSGQRRGVQTPEIEA